MILDEVELAFALELGSPRNRGVRVSHKKSLLSGENAAISIQDAKGKVHNLVFVCPTISEDGRAIKLSARPTKDSFFVLDCRVDAIVPRGKALLIRTNAEKRVDGKRLYLMMKPRPIDNMP